jgi:hypothetical protein
MLVEERRSAKRRSVARHTHAGASIQWSFGQPLSMNIEILVWSMFVTPLVSVLPIDHRSIRHQTLTEPDSVADQQW